MYKIIAYQVSIVQIYTTTRQHTQPGNSWHKAKKEKKKPIKLKQRNLVATFISVINLPTYLFTSSYHFWSQITSKATILTSILIFTFIAHMNEPTMDHYICFEN